jgi:hypothetical protein
MKADMFFSKFSLGLVIVVGLASSAPASNALLGLWRFNDGSGTTAADSSGLGHNGTLVGENGNIPAWVPGQPGFGTALRFTNNYPSDPSAGRAYVDVPASDSLKVGLTTNDTWSFTCWAYEISDGAGGFVADYGRIFTQDGGKGLGWESGAAGDAEFYAWLQDKPEWWIGFGFDTGVVPVFDQWVHWALVYDGTNVTMYRNGNQSPLGGDKTSVAVSSSLNWSGYAGSLQIGSQSDYGIYDASRNWHGMLDDFAVFRGALTEAEIGTIMTGDFSAYLGGPPAIVGQPADLAVNQGLDAAFAVSASSQSPMTYQWKFNGNDLAGATTSSLTVTNVQTGNAGSYSVIVSNTFGSIPSAGAVLTVLVPLPPRLVGLWRFDEGAGINVLDGSGLANHGVLTSDGPDLPVWVPGQTGFGSALQFQNNVEYNYVAVPASDSLKIGMTANDTWTITAWTKEQSDGAGNFVAHYGRVFAYDDGWGLNFNSGYTGDVQYYIWHNSYAGIWQRGFGTDAAVVPVLDQWVHLALVYDGQSLTLYRNGNVSAQGGAKTSIPVRSSVAFTDHGGYSGALQIGSVNNEPVDHNWNGLIDDFAVFTGALSESQLKTVMDGDFSSFYNSAPLLSLTPSGKQVVVSWGFGTLQSSTNVVTGWQDVAGWTSSPLILTPEEAQRFYRVKR